ncbi:hypothetical protein BGX27_006883 [Mortierella sp. AM989]|nr:hypothetical protein BGX27_006883 [Mortierella sp. AM989]
MSLSIFDIPHIKDDITQYLSNHDIAQCVLTCKEWFAWFSPSFSYQVDLYNIATTYYGLSALEKHRDYVRTITIRSKVLISYASALLPFPRLHSLNFEFQEDLVYRNDALIDIIAAIPSLRSLKLTIKRLRPNTYERLVQTLASHPNLEHLGLVLLNVEDPQFIPRLLDACKNYKSLNLYPMALVEVDGTEEHLPESIQPPNAITDSTQNMRCRDLSIYLPNPTRGYIAVIEMLKLFPLLERLVLYQTTQESLQQVSNLLKDNICPRLKHLRLESVCITDGNMKTIVELIRSVGCWRGNTVERLFKDTGYETNGGLESFVADFYFLFDASIPQALIECHAKTLTVLDLSNSRSISFLPFMHAVSSLPKLRSIKAPISLCPDMTHDSHQLEEQLKSPWLCLGLKTLDLTMALQNIPGLSSQDVWKDSLADPCASYIFDQINRLKDLRMLGLRCSIQLLTMEKGYLTRLSGLMQLRHLVISGSNVSELRENEANWMIDNWPRMVHITLRFVDKWEAIKILAKRRPWIVVETVR